MISGAVSEHEPLVAIAALDKAFFVNLKPDARMAEGCSARNIGRAITGDAVRGDSDGFRCLDHGRPDSNSKDGWQCALLVDQRQPEVAGIVAGGLIGADIETRADTELEHAGRGTDGEETRGGAQR